MRVTLIGDPFNGHAIDVSDDAESIDMIAGGTSHSFVKRGYTITSAWPHPGDIKTYFVLDRLQHRPLEDLVAMLPRGTI